jgi:branched-chain amino acid transport system permease protein
MTCFAVLDWFADNETLIQTALIYALIGFSVQISMRTGMFSLAGIGFYGTGAYVAGNLAIDGMAPILAIAVAVAQSAVLGLLLALILARLKSLYLAMATFAFVLLVQVAAIQWEDFTGGAIGLFGIPVGVSTTGLVVAVVISAAILIAYERGRTGRMLEALRLDAQLAGSVGIAVVRQRDVAFVLSSMFGGLAGALSALLFNLVTPADIGFGLIVNALMIVVIGGTSAWYGPLIGAFIVVWLPEILGWTGGAREIVEAIVLIALIIFAPDGAVGLIRRLRRFVSRRHVRKNLALVKPKPSRSEAAQ